MAQYKKEDFRIAYDALYGFYIEKKINILPTELPQFNSMRSIFKYRPLIDQEIHEVNGIWGRVYHDKMPKDIDGIIGVFPTKYEAIQFIKDLCSETEYYYPPEFENAND